MKIIGLLVLLFTTALVSCNSNNQKSPKNIQAEPSEYQFSVPEIPMMISAPEHQSAYLAEHYWDNFDFKDSTDLELKKIIEKAFAEYCVILGTLENKKASESVRGLMQRASDNNKLSLYFAERAEKYLYHPNSPIRNEFLYEEFLKGLLENQGIEPLRKSRFQYQFDLAQKNKPGTKATDFEYTFKDGRKSSLYKTPGKWIMLYFFNPDCQECAVMKDRIQASSIIQKLQKSGAMEILAVYPDKDLSIWNKHYAEFPDSWIKVYDQETIIENEELYDLKAIPTIYLLDRDQTVLLRDPTFEQFEEYLGSL